MIVKPNFGVKAPIKGVSFSNEEASLGLEFEVADNDWVAVEEELYKQVQAVAKKYFNKLAEEIEEGQDNLLDKIKVELSKEYEEKLELAKAEIIKLREQLNGI